MSLKTVVAQRIQTEVIGSVSKKGEWKVLVVDQHSMRVISSCCKMHEIMQNGITLVESIEKGRQPLPQLEAIYFIAPIDTSVTALVRDFVNERSERKYRAAHVFFTETLPDNLFQKLSVPAVAKVIKTLKEVNVSFLPQESNAFHLDFKDALRQFYSAQQVKGRESRVERLAEQIATVCTTLGEYPAIRYRAELTRTRELADMVQSRLDAYKRDVDSELGSGPGKNRSQLLILDRGFDPTSPLLHELTYQAMTYDLLDIKNDVFRYEPTGGTSSAVKEVLLDEGDDLWVELRHLHIAEVSKKVASLLKSFAESKKETKGKNVTMRELSKLIKKMPQYQKELSRYSLHSHLAEDNMSKYRDSVEKLVSIEQDLAMGVDTEGEKVKDPMRLIVPVLLDESIGKLEKIRILLLFIIHKNGITDENLEKLMRHAGIPATEAGTILNMQQLGVKIVQEDGGKKKKRSKRREWETEYILSRWVPVVKDIMEDCIEGSLDQDLYPFLRREGARAALSSGDDSAQAGARSARWKFRPEQAATEVKSGPRLIVFIVGGACYSEMRCAYEVSNKQSDWEVVVGGTTFLTPNDLLKQLQHLTSSDGGAAV